MTKFHSRKISVIGLKLSISISALIILGRHFNPFIIHFCFRFSSHYNVVQMMDNRSLKKITSLIVRHSRRLNRLVQKRTSKIQILTTCVELIFDHLEMSVHQVRPPQRSSQQCVTTVRFLSKLSGQIITRHDSIYNH